MIFYKFKCKTTKAISFKTDDELHSAHSKLADKCSYYCKNFMQKELFAFLYKIDEEYYIFDMVYAGSIYDLECVDKAFDDLIKFLDIDYISIEKEEILFSMFHFDLNNLCYYLPLKREIENVFNLGGWDGMDFKEVPLKNKMSKTEALNTCKSLPITDLKDEVKRIYAKTENKNFAVPVHYFLMMDDRKTYERTVDLLVKSLYSNNRIIRNKYTVCNVNMWTCHHCSYTELERLFSINEGGLMILNIELNIEESSRYTEEEEIAEKFCKKIKKYANKMVVIICVKLRNQMQINFLKQNLDDLLFIEAKEILLRNERAQQMMLNVIKDDFITNPVGLVDLIEKDKDYEINELQEIYDNWYKKYVKTELYPQYSNFIGREIKKLEDRPEEHGMDDLNALIGLDKVKHLMQNYINYQIVQKARPYSERYNVCRHMTFVGNPGTAKTTVARIVATIMREKGLLSKGKLIEVGRSDIVSRYVGGTAPKVKELFERAKGCVLFIDEAYSLYDGREGLYGDEAINAIVQEMENNRDDVVVIFAGYKKEMDKFLDKNSGLRSRIAYEVQFDDYNEDELVKIANYTAQKMNIDLSQCEDRLKEIIHCGKQEKNFGNGRYVRNVLEHAMVNQATRIVKENKLDSGEINVILPEDFELPKVSKSFNLGFRD